MKRLDKVIAIRGRLLRRLVQHQGVTAVEIATLVEDIRLPADAYILRIFVSDPDIGLEELGLSRLYEGVPVYVAYRRPPAY